MWFMKSYGGLAHVRRISSSELAQGTVKMGFMINILVYRLFDEKRLNP
jgi:hypothetical protein